jgi:Fungal specific transcription factor domain
MVNIPGSSRGCKECRVRHIKVRRCYSDNSPSICSRAYSSNHHCLLKCGLEQPSCVRCLKSGFYCSGPKTGSVFIQRDINNIKGVSDRKLLNAAIHNQSSDASNHARKPERITYGDWSTSKPRTPLHAVPGAGCQPDVYRSLVDDFWLVTRAFPKTPARRDAQQPISFGAVIIFPLAFSNEALGNAVFAVTAMYLGTLRGDTKLLRLGMEAYPSALRRFRSELTSTFDHKAGQKHGLESVMAIVLSLLLYEVSFYGTLRSTLLY